MFELFAITLDTLGTIMIAFAALRVHHRVLHDHKIDKKVFKMMKLEQWVGALGVLFVAVGYIIIISERFY